MTPSETQKKNSNDPTPRDAPTCPHCNERMKAMNMPMLANFDSPFIFVCFNNDCSYFLRGWEWMMSHYASKTSYRYKLDPFTGESGPLPVWSADALRNQIIEEEPS